MTREVPTMESMDVNDGRNAFSPSSTRSHFLQILQAVSCTGPQRPMRRFSPTNQILSVNSFLVQLRNHRFACTLVNTCKHLHMRTCVCLQIGACTEVHVRRCICVREKEKGFEVSATWQICLRKFLPFAEHGSSKGKMHQQLACMFTIHAEAQQRMKPEMRHQLHERPHGAFMQVFFFC